MKLSAHHGGDFVKVMYLGDSGTGKTGSLASLVKDGYTLRILDLDNGLDTLRQIVARDAPDGLDRVDYETRRDRYKATKTGPKLEGTPTAFTDSLALMTQWSDGTDPSQGGPQSIFVLDSLSSLGRAAFEWARFGAPSIKDPRQWFYTAQHAIEDIISNLTSESFRANVIVITHVSYQDVAEGLTKGYPNSIGRALGPIISRYFNTLILAESIGSGKNVRRTIRTVPTGIIDLKTPAFFKLAVELPLEIGLSTLFKALKETSK